MKMKIYSFLAMVLLCLVMTSLKAQVDPCGSSVDLQWLQTNAPDRYQRFMDLESFTSNFIAS